MKAVILIISAFVAIPLRAEHALVSRDVFHGDARLAVIDAATKAEACILSVQDPSRGADLNRRTFVEGHYKMLPESVRTLIVWKLLDDRSYTWDSVSACIPTYNARVRFTAGGRTVDIDFCFGCSQVRVLERGSVVGGGYFEPGSDWVFRALATQFPDDPIIRQVKKRREEVEADRLAIEMAKARNARKEKANTAPD